jgi:hypothetical protein
MSPYRVCRLMRFVAYRVCRIIGFVPGPLMNRLKQFREIFRFRGDIRENGVSAYYSNTRTPCPRITVIRGHGVRVLL